MRVLLLGLVAACSFDGGTSPAANGGDAMSDSAIDGAPATCIEGWCKRKALVMPAVVGGPHSDFPVLVSLDADAQLAASARNDGFDVMFTDDSGARLSYERLQFEKPTGKLVAWVKVPSLVAGTVIYLYYGNASATDQARPVQTWSNGWVGVWHVEESSGTLYDASGNNNLGGVNGGIKQGMPGQIGRGVQIEGAMGGIITMTKSTTLDAVAPFGTIELLVKWTDAADPSGHQLLMSSSNRYTTPDGFEWGSQAGGNHYFYPWGGAGGDYNLGPNPYTSGAWHHAAVTLDYSMKAVRIYVDGVAMPLTHVAVPTQWTQVAQPGNWLWGGNPSETTYYFDGMMDEMRASNIARTGDWIATESANQLTPAAFFTLGPEEALQH